MLLFGECVSLGIANAVYSIEEVINSTNLRNPHEEYQQNNIGQRQFMKALKSRRFGQDQANALTVVIFR